MNSLLRTGLIVAALMIASVAAAHFMKPTARSADQLPKLNLESAIPSAFGDWKVDTSAPPMLVSPDVKAELDKIYNQTLSRVYVNSRGERVMLSIAYGGDQSDSLTVHMPEGCYTGQGFQIRFRDAHVIDAEGARIPLVRLLAEKGQRSEPISYWIFIGSDFATSRAERKLAQLKSSLLGTIPEGLLVRVSNISREKDQSYALHEDFIGSMVSAIPPEKRKRIVG